MDLETRAALVRALRFELKQEMLEYALRRDEQRVRNRINRATQRVRRTVGRAIDKYQEWDNANLRRMNMREAARVRAEGYDIRPDFAAASQRVRNRQVSNTMRNQAGGGINRWRGSVTEVGREQRAAHPSPRVLSREERARAGTLPLSERLPTDPWPEPRRRARSTVIYHDRAGERREERTVDRPPRRRRN